MGIIEESTMPVARANETPSVSHTPAPALSVCSPSPPFSPLPEPVVPPLGRTPIPAGTVHPSLPNPAGCLPVLLFHRPPLIRPKADTEGLLVSSKGPLTYGKAEPSIGANEAKNVMSQRNLPQEEGRVHGESSGAVWGQRPPVKRTHRHALRAGYIICVDSHASLRRRIFTSTLKI